MDRNTLIGIVMALASTAIGGTAVAATRAIAPDCDPVMLAALRFAVGSVALLPVVVVMRRQLPRGHDLIACVALGLLFFGAFPILFNRALALAPAAHGALALCTLPVMTIIVAAVMGRERPCAARLAGTVLALGGIVIMLAPSLSGIADPKVLTGDVLMLLATLGGAVYAVTARPYLQRIPPLLFTAIAMPSGTLALLLVAGLSGRFMLPPLDGVGWGLVVYLGLIGGALMLALWTLALRRASASTVALTITLNPVTAAIVGALWLGEPVGGEALAGFVLVAIGIAVATLLPARLRAAIRPAAHAKG